MNPIIASQREILVKKAAKIFDVLLMESFQSGGCVHAAERAALKALEILRGQIVTSSVATCIGSADRNYHCPLCDLALSRWSLRERQIVTVAGAGQFGSERYRCRKCLKDFYPWQIANGLDDSQYTLGAREEIAADAASAQSYQDASKRLAKRGIPVSASEVDRIVNEVGAWRKQEEQMVRALSCRGASASLPLHNYSTLPGIAPVGTVAVVSMDGGMIRSNTQGDKGLDWFEARSSVIRFQIKNKTLFSACTAGVRNPDEVYEILRSQWQQIPKKWRTGKDAPRLVFLADGAEWIWLRARWYFPNALLILDVYHASEHVASAARACWGANSELAKLWANNALNWLQEPGAAKIILTAMINVLRAGRARDPKQLRTEIGYLWRHRHHMHYDKWNAQGLPIGSGVIESNIKQVSKRRLVQAGMKWTKPHADLMLHVRAAYLCNALSLTIDRERKIRKNRAMQFYTQADKLSVAA